MSRRALSENDLATLTDLVERNGADSVIGAARAVGKKVRKVGRPSGYAGNLVGVYGYVEFHRRTKGAGGRKLGVEGACLKLRRLFDRWTVNYKTSAGRLKTMYYEAQKLARKNPNFEQLMLQSVAKYEEAEHPELMFPTPLKVEKDGTLRSVTIDRSGRGGRGGR